jgi:hypothetical protein
LALALSRLLFTETPSQAPLKSALEKVFLFSVVAIELRDFFGMQEGVFSLTEDGW